MIFECPKCDGCGWNFGHDLPARHHPDTGECLTCPAQLACELCEGDGQLDESTF